MKNIIFSEFSILYKEIFLEVINKKMIFNYESKSPQYFEYADSFKIIYNYSGAKLEINFMDFFHLESFCKNQNISLSIDSQRIIKYLKILEELKYNSMQWVDIVSPKYKNISITEMISSRCSLLAESFFKDYLSNILYSSFSLRDLIDNIKLLLYLFLGESKEKIEKNEFGTFTYSFKKENAKEKIIKQIDGLEKMNYSFKDIMIDHPSLEDFKNEFSQLDKIGKICNDYIHKNGFDKIDNRLLKSYNSKDIFEMYLYCIRLYFYIIVIYDGKSLIASDYFDAIENGEEPPYESEIWIAPIFNDFINSEFNEEEKEFMRMNSTMEVKIYESSID